MEPSKEAISVRTARLNNIFFGKLNQFLSSKQNLSREGLLDALTALYNDYNETSNKETNVGLFVDKYRSIVLELRKLRVNVDDFERKTVIGRGHYGEVQLVREKHTDDIYAMKTLKKCDTLKGSSFYEEERDIMAMTTSPWLTTLQYAFQDFKNLYLVMEFLPGGDLSGLLEMKGNSLPEWEACFYLAELVLAIRSLHTMGYVHRDVKPSNVLLDRCGHIKLADFGSAAKLTGAGLVVSAMPVGTPHYVAPEVLRAMECGAGDHKSAYYGVECDYWSLGVVAYELIAGRTPYSGLPLVDIYSNIMTSQPEFPSEFRAGGDYKLLVSELLRDSSDRLGHDQIVKHPCFQHVDFNSIRNTMPPHVPTVLSDDDTCNFAAVSRLTPTPSMHDFKTPKPFTGRDLPFIGYSFTSEPVDVASNAGHLKAAFNAKKKEVEELQKKLHFRENDEEDRSREVKSLKGSLENKQRSLESAQSQAGSLSRDCERLKRENTLLRRTIEQGKEDQRAQEEKALRLIRDMKADRDRRFKDNMLKLSAETDALRSEAAVREAECQHMAEQLARKEQELEDARSEGQMLRAMTQDHNDKLAKARRVSRMSVCGAESQVERIISSHKQQLVELQAALDEEREKHLTSSHELEVERENNLSQVRRLQDDLRESQSELNAAETQIIALREELCTSADKAEARARDAGQQLARERAQCKELKTKVAMLESELSETLTERTALETTVTEHTERTSLVRQELNRATAEREQLRDQLNNAVQSEADVSLKVSGLEALLEQFQQGLARMEAENAKLRARNSVAQQPSTMDARVLEAQLEKTEAQLDKLREASVLDKKARTESDAKLWKVEKELSDSKIDLRIAQRETKNAEEALRAILEKHAANRAAWKLSAQAATDGSAQAERCATELRALLDESEAKVAALQAEVKDKEKAVKKLQESQSVSSSKLSESVTGQAMAKQEVIALSLEVKQLSKRVAELEAQLADATRREKEARAAKNEADANAKALRDNMTSVQQTSEMLEEQLEDFDKLIATYEAKIASLNKTKNDLESEVASLGKELQTARQATNEEKSLKLKAELQLKMAEAELEGRREEAASLESQACEYRAMVADLTAQVSELEEACTADQSDTREALRRADAMMRENNTIKEELSRHLTHLHSLRESNFSLTADLAASAAELAAAEQRLEDAERQRVELQAFNKQREYKTSATLEQQAKLIAYLQGKVEEAGRKKKTLTEKIFGQKENVAPAKQLEAKLAQERVKSAHLNEKLYRAKAELAVSRNDQVSAAIAPDTPRTKRAIATLANSPSKLPRAVSAARMHHNIPHRFELRLCMRAAKCAGCLDGVHVGRSVAVCVDCGVSAHSKCSLTLPDACGLPRELARHFSRTLERPAAQGEKAGGASGEMRGFVKLPCRKNTSWERRYVILAGSTLRVYRDQPADEAEEPEQVIEICPENGATSIVTGVAVSDVSNTAKSDLTFIIKIVITPLTTCWPGSSQLIMTLGFPAKQAWAAALEAVVQRNHKSTPRDTRLKGISTLLTLDKTKPLTFNCALNLSPTLLLLGADEGLFSLRLCADAAPTAIAGVTEVHQVAQASALGLTLMIAGAKRSLVQCDARRLNAAAEAAECSRPTIEVGPVLVAVDDLCCHLFSVATTEQGRTVLCAATSEKLIIMTWNPESAAFNPTRQLDTAEPISCILFTPHTILLGANKFFEIELQHFVAEEFLDASDRTLIAGGQLCSFPMALLDVSASAARPEYLLCFNECGTFVDQMGQRSRRDDIKWSHMPFAFAYHRPHLFVFHFSSVEVLRLTPQSYTRRQDLPEPTFIELSNPRYLGSTPDGAVCLSHADERGGTRIVTMRGPAVCRADSIDTASSVQGEGVELNSSEFSFTSSLVQSLDGSTDDENDQLRVRFDSHTMHTEL